MKKAMLNIQEMAFMLVALIFFFILVSLFAFSLLYSGIEKDANLAREKSSITLLRTISESPELKCIGSKPNCVDPDKALIISKKPGYSNYWGFSSLKIMKYSSFNKSENQIIECNLNNYPNCDFININDKKIKNEKQISTFISLCYNEYDNGYYEKCEVAKIIAGVEIKNA
jgi:hypothetical protein